MARWKHLGGGRYGDPVTGEGSGGDQAIAAAFQDAGITETGDYRVRAVGDETSPPDFYRLTVNAELFLIEFPS
jgi:hypothetical protein